MPSRVALAVLLLPIAVAGASRGNDGQSSPSSPETMSGPLVSAQTTMATAWDFPQNPLTDPALDASKLSNEIRWGFKIFTSTPAEVPGLARAKVSCNNCNLNGGQR